jgi:hypothetical protein
MGVDVSGKGVVGGDGARVGAGEAEVGNVGAGGATTQLASRDAVLAVTSVRTSRRLI